jgi:hypothetical protein
MDVEKKTNIVRIRISHLSESTVRYGGLNEVEKFVFETNNIFGRDAEIAEVVIENKSNLLGYRLLDKNQKYMCIASFISSKSFDYWRLEYIESGIENDFFEPNIERFLNFIFENTTTIGLLGNNSKERYLKVPLVVYTFYSKDKLSSIRYYPPIGWQFKPNL